MGSVIAGTMKNEGPGAFYKGIVWAWGREGSYASIKLGCVASPFVCVGIMTIGLTCRF
jgi:hypothetical protein